MSRVGSIYRQSATVRSVEAVHSLWSSFFFFFFFFIPTSFFLFSISLRYLLLFHFFIINQHRYSLFIPRPFSIYLFRVHILIPLLTMLFDLDFFIFLIISILRFQFPMFFQFQLSLCCFLDPLSINSQYSSQKKDDRIMHSFLSMDFFST